MKKTAITAARHVLCAAAAVLSLGAAAQEPADYVDPFIGTNGMGHTFPGACVPFGADALTVNGYLGSDGINPLLDICERDDKGIFVLCKTSNPSSGELQDKALGDVPLYAAMGDMCEQWGAQTGRYGYSCVGAVVGATYPEQLRELRERMKKTFFLVPGYGAQGGKAEAQGGAQGPHTRTTGRKRRETASEIHRTIRKTESKK